MFHVLNVILFRSLFVVHMIRSLYEFVWVFQELFFGPQLEGPGFYMKVPFPRWVALTIAKAPHSSCVLVRAWHFITELPANSKQVRASVIRYLRTRCLRIMDSPQGTNN